MKSFEGTGEVCVSIIEKGSFHDILSASQRWNLSYIYSIVNICFS